MEIENSYLVEENTAVKLYFEEQVEIIWGLKERGFSVEKHIWDAGYRTCKEEKSA